MKRSVIIVFMAALLFTSQAFSGEIVPTAGEVDIYPYGARLYMDFEVEKDFLLELPGTLKKDSISIVARDGTVKVDKFTVLEETRTGWIPPSLREMDRAIKELDSQKKGLESDLGSLKQTRTYLNGLKPEELEGGDFIELLQKLQDKRRTVEVSIKEKERALQELDHKIKALMAEFNSRMPQDRNRVFIVKGITQGKGKLRLSAWTDHSRWSPVHNMDLNTSEHLVSSKLEAQVSQKSGIDWKGELRFHTVQPKRSISTPRPGPLTVDFREDLRKTDMVLSESLNRAGKAVSAPQAIKITETMTDMAIAADDNISGTGQITTIDLGTMEIPGNLEMVALPYLSDDTWVLHHTESLMSPIIPGKVHLFLDGESSGQTSVKEYARGEEFVMAFGSSPLLKVRREKIIPKKGSNWIGKGTLEEGYSITVTNGLNRDTKIEVIDRIPLSVQEKIQVSLLETEPQPDESSEEGILKWKMSLNKGESRKIKVLYRIKYPSDRDIVFR